MKVYWIVVVAGVFSIDWTRRTVDASPLNNQTRGSMLTRAEGGEFHLFPAWVAELGEVGLFILDYVWHHQIVEEVHEVGSLVEEVDAKLDALIAVTPGAAQQLHLKKSFDEHFQKRISDRPFKSLRSGVKKGRRKQLEREEDIASPFKQLTLALSMAFSGLINWIAPHIG